MKICEWCGEDIPEEEIRHGNQKYHKECGKKADRKSKNEHRKEKIRKARNSKTLICAWCGEEIAKEEIKHGRQKYHKECGKKAYRADRKSYADRIKEKRRKARDSKTFICAWCGEEIAKEEIKACTQKYHKECGKKARRERVNKRKRRHARQHRMEQNKYKYIYFLHAPNGLIKIGRAINIKKRIRSIQGMSPVQLTVLYAFHGPEYLEKALHDKFEHLKSNVSTIHTEWFYDSLEIHEEIESLKKQYGQVKIKLNAHADK